MFDGREMYRPASQQAQLAVSFETVAAAVPAPGRKTKTPNRFVFSESEDGTSEGNRRPAQLAYCSLSISRSRSHTIIPSAPIAFVTSEFMRVSTSTPLARTVNP